MVALRVLIVDPKRFFFIAICHPVPSYRSLKIKQFIPFGDKGEK